MTATNDDLLAEMKEIKNLLFGIYAIPEQAERLKNSTNIKQTAKDIKEGK